MPKTIASPVTYLSIKEFIDYMNISRRFLEEQFLYRKDFPAFRVGRNWRIKAEEAAAYIEKKGTKK